MATYYVPDTWVRLFKDTGIDEYNKPYFENVNELIGWMIDYKENILLTDFSYQRADERQYIAVSIDYNEAITYDTIAWINQGHEPKTWFVANITGVEFKNPNTTWIYFKVDAFCTFCGNIEWEKSYSLVEREHVADDWNGDVPNYDNIGVSEGLNPVLEKPLYAYVFYAGQSYQYVVRDPYFQYDEGKYAIGGGTRDNVYGMEVHIFNSGKEVNNYLDALQENSRTDVEKVVDIQTIPNQTVVANNAQVFLTPPWSSVQYNNAKCFSSEFCLLRVESLAADTVSYKPELFGDSDLNRIHFFMQLMSPAGSYCLLVYPTQYPKGGGNSGEYYGFKIQDFPHGNFSADTFAQWLSINLLPSAIRGGIGAIQTVTGAGAAIGGLSAGNPVAAFTGTMQAAHGASTLVNTVAQFNDARMHGTSLGGEFGMTNAAFAAACNHLGYSISWYMPNDPTMAFVDSYFDRFGYKVMKLKVPERKSRPFWNYVKTVEGHIAGTMPANYRQDIEALLNGGVTFWHVENGQINIGDFSNPTGNKG